jgi:hypothetical protein
VVDHTNDHFATIPKGEESGVIIRLAIHTKNIEFVNFSPCLELPQHKQVPPQITERDHKNYSQNTVNLFSG